MAEKLKVYFACSIRGEQGGQEEKELIVSTIKDLGHEVLSEVFLGQDSNKNELGIMSPQQIYDRDILWVDQADIIVADVTRISMGVGFEIGWRLRGGGRVLGLCREDRFESLTNMIKGCTEAQFSLHIWRGLEHPEDIRKILKNELGQAEDPRFWLLW